MIFFDTSYLARLYLDEAGAVEVRELAAAMPICAAWHAQAELFCTFHRALREGRLDLEGYLAQRAQFAFDNSNGLFHWLPLTESTMGRLDAMLAKVSAGVFLRAADALHLACAAENGLKEVYSNDRHFLAAAPLFGLKAKNIIG
jgi:predicted nucleic acid-binding protein